MSALGILLAVAVDIALPAFLLIRWIPRNRRYGSRQGERQFWIGIGIYLASVSIWVALALVGTYRFQGTPTLAAVFFALPMSIIPSLFNSNVMEHFFTSQEWYDYGFLVVLTTFLVGLVLWAAVLPVGIRRAAQYGVERAAPKPTPQFSPSSD